MKNFLNILVVEDDPTAQEILSKYLEGYGHFVIVDCGEKAIKECKAHIFHLILLDIKSKNGLDGVRTLKKIKEIVGYKDIPVLAVTGYSMKGDKEYFLQEGFNGYLAKPFHKETFVEFIKYYLPIT
jgi:CheY-like chemotaxis protein